MDAARTILFLGTCVPVLTLAIRSKILRRALPVAKKVPDTIYFGVNPKDPKEDRGPNPMDPPKTRVDEYNWLRDESRKSPEVLAHLKAENEYCDEMTQDLKHLQDTLYDDMLARLKVNVFTCLFTFLYGLS
jgi:Prolyl oligopeptidase, N-terminal beta-propeller domain